MGGHCIGVDPYYLTHKAEQVGYDPQLILAGRKVNDGMSRYLVTRIIQKMAKGGIQISGARIGILGVTFKDNCPDTRNSKVFDVINEFAEWGATCVVSDPWCDSEELTETYNINLVNLDANFKVDVLVVAVGHAEFQQLTPNDLRALCCGEPPIIADVKSLFDPAELAAVGFDVFRL